MTQEMFLLNMGFDVRFAVLSSKVKRKGKAGLRHACQRLIDRTGMGTEYKVLGLTGNGARQTAQADDEEVWPFVKNPPRRPGN